MQSRQPLKKGNIVRFPNSCQKLGWFEIWWKLPISFLCQEFLYFCLCVEKKDSEIYQTVLQSPLNYQSTLQICEVTKVPLCRPRASGMRPTTLSFLTFYNFVIWVTTFRFICYLMDVSILNDYRYAHDNPRTTYSTLEQWAGNTINNIDILVGCPCLRHQLLSNPVQYWPLFISRDGNSPKIRGSSRVGLYSYPHSKGGWNHG